MTPTFGQWVESRYASKENPQHHGMFVKSGHRPHGRMNGGPWWELTDGRGDFWQVVPENCIVLPTVSVAIEGKVGELYEEQLVWRRRVDVAEAAIARVHALGMKLLHTTGEEFVDLMTRHHGADILNAIEGPTDVHSQNEPFYIDHRNSPY